MRGASGVRGDAPRLCCTGAFARVATAARTKEKETADIVRCSCTWA